jgi:hypothetical protein
VFLPAAVLALGLGGLPLTGGALAKLAVKAVFGPGFVRVLAALSAAGSTFLMLHFLRRLAAIGTTDFEGASPTGLVWPWLAIAFAAVAIPWILYPVAKSGTRLDALALGEVWAGLWPILLGSVFALGLWGSGRRLPRVPEGDIVVAGEAAVRAAATWSVAIERADSWLRQWPVASSSLLAIAILLGAAMLAWR